MNIHLAPVRNSKLADELVDAILALDFDHISDERAVLTGLVEGFFSSLQADIVFGFHGVVGVAATVALKSPKHQAACKCVACAPPRILRHLIREMKDFRAQEEELKHSLMYGCCFRGKPVTDVATVRQTLEDEIAPKEIERLAKEHVECLEQSEY